MRFIIEGTGGYTAVNGEKTNMTPGDFIITPSWTWHHHGHDGDEPVVWLDGLDLPIARTIGAIFYEPYSEEFYPEGPPPETETQPAQEPEEPAPVRHVRT